MTKQYQLVLIFSVYYRSDLPWKKRNTRASSPALFSKRRWCLTFFFFFPSCKETLLPSPENVKTTSKRRSSLAENTLEQNQGQKVKLISWFIFLQSRRESHKHRWRAADKWGEHLHEAQRPNDTSLLGNIMQTLDRPRPPNNSSAARLRSSRLMYQDTQIPFLFSFCNKLLLLSLLNWVYFLTLHMLQKKEFLFIYLFINAVQFDHGCVLVFFISPLREGEEGGGDS